MLAAMAEFSTDSDKAAVAAKAEKLSDWEITVDGNSAVAVSTAEPGSNLPGSGAQTIPLVTVGGT